MTRYIHQLAEWPKLTWDRDALAVPLADIRYRRLLGRMESLGFSLQQEAELETLTLDVVKSSEIEGENLNTDQVRSSIARRLGIDIAGRFPPIGTSRVLFLVCLGRAFEGTEATLATVLHKARFWREHADVNINDRQRLLLNKILDGFDGKLTSSKWARIAKCSQDTAIRDIKDLVAQGVLEKDAGGGRSTSYSLFRRNIATGSSG